MFHTNTQTQTTISNKPIGSLPRRYTAKFARLMQEIRQVNPALADAIREQIVTAQTAERTARRMLTRYRIAKRRVPVLNFFKAGR
ncbi:MAG: hypothetical protein COA70_03360 [Planctomycetota bacterium]|nr:MAG: hypothetical protein COA70_03360 [Planctomycetota bacterium]